MLSALAMLAVLAAPADLGDACAEPAAAIELAAPVVKEFEGLARCVGPKSDPCAILAAYPDPGVGAKLPTIGYGHTSLAGGGHGVQVRMGATITRLEAEAILRADLEAVVGQVCRLVKRPLTPPQLAGLISFTYNLGSGTLARSVVLRYIKAGRFDQAARDMRRYVHAGSPKRVYPGLVKRRSAEASLLDEETQAGRKRVVENEFSPQGPIHSQ